MTSTEQNQPTAAELLRRIEELEGRLGRTHGLRRLRPARLGMMAGLVLTLILGPSLASHTGAASPQLSFWALNGNSITAGSFLGTTNAQDLAIKTNNAEAMRITSGGNVGVGTSSPVSKLDVNGTINGTTLKEGGASLASKYALLDGGNATGTWPIGISGNAVTATNFTGSLSGDVAGGQSSTAVTKINGSPLGTTTGASTGQVLMWNGTNWAPGTGPAAAPVLCPGCFLQGATLPDANLVDAQFGLDRSGTATDLSYASLSGANLSNSNLMQANLSNAYVTNANLTGGALYGTNLTSAALISANLTDANILHANLTNANLTNANLYHATGGQVDPTTGVTWSNTTCPDGTNSNDDGNTCVGNGHGF